MRAGPGMWDCADEDAFVILLGEMLGLGTSASASHGLLARVAMVGSAVRICQVRHFAFIATSSIRAQLRKPDTKSSASARSAVLLIECTLQQSLLPMLVRFAHHGS